MGDLERLEMKLISTYFEVTWFDVDPNDELVGSEKVDITETKVRECFYIHPEEKEPVLDGFLINASHKNFLQPYLKHVIDLNKYDYYFEHVGVYGKDGK